MKLAIEWFLNPDHLPIIIAQEKRYLKDNGISNFELIVPTDHYDGLQDLIEGNIQLATNEPLHLIEQHHPEFLSLGTYFETKGGVLMKTASFELLKNGGTIQVATPVSNDKTNGIGLEIIKRYAAKQGVTVEASQVEFVAKDFYLVKHMNEGADAGWLYFYNFEGVEAEHENLEVIHMDADSAGFANFCALDLFTSQTYYEKHPEKIDAFVKAIQKAIEFIETHPEEAFKIYYTYINEESSPLMDDILKATARCFHKDFKSSAEKELPILHFFNEIGITNLSEDKFKNAFLN
ncbi:ABC transporter substrate-binding protein [Psychroflexus montanilacus]|uniref:ABC transporter substrate-binding protein n=1 Tax=Psychroflexus montanilacus TaxID=2873598 RepID=UPI001CC9A7C7|nr:ABC transporter substrate-binding protein [Psychroflexus montanilacus]MBZ9651907.1 ABC transporter substrate-binding protein [Psychroflexus montanilacus]